MYEFNASGLYAANKQFSDAYDIALTPLAKELSMSTRALDILLFLANNPGKDTSADVCACRGLKPGIVSFHVDTLVKSGYVERQEDVNDRRKCRLIPTEKAQPIIKRGREVQETFARVLTDGLSASELQIVLRCLKKMRENIEQLTKRRR